jgi:lipoprotein-anchoring transpeptidase ErfK/SrfK
MRPPRGKMLHLRSLMTVALIAAAKAACQENQSPATASAGPPRRIVISIPDRKLALIENGQVIRIYQTAVGAPASPTPAGTYTIAQRVPNPTWYGPAGQVVGPGKGNPVGTRWMGLSRKGYGIHGTNQPQSIGKRASHGCIRMRNRDVEDLFERVAVGDVVELRGVRDAEITQIFGGSEGSIAATAAGGGQ